MQSGKHSNKASQRPKIVLSCPHAQCDIPEYDYNEHYCDWVAEEALIELLKHFPPEDVFHIVGRDKRVEVDLNRTPSRERPFRKSLMAAINPHDVHVDVHSYPDTDRYDDWWKYDLVIFNHNDEDLVKCIIDEVEAAGYTIKKLPGDKQNDICCSVEEIGAPTCLLEFSSGLGKDESNRMPDACAAVARGIKKRFLVRNPRSNAKKRKVSKPAEKTWVDILIDSIRTAEEKGVEFREWLVYPNLSYAIAHDSEYSNMIVFSWGTRKNDQLSLTSMPTGLIGGNEPYPASDSVMGRRRTLTKSGKRLSDNEYKRLGGYQFPENITNEQALDAMEQTGIPLEIVNRNPMLRGDLVSDNYRKAPISEVLTAKNPIVVIEDADWHPNYGHYMDYINEADDMAWDIFAPGFTNALPEGKYQVEGIHCILELANGNHKICVILNHPDYNKDLAFRQIREFKNFYQNRTKMRMRLKVKEHYNI